MGVATLNAFWGSQSSNPSEPSPTIECYFDVYASYPDLMIIINFINGTPENYWVRYSLISHDGTTYGPVDLIEMGSQDLIDLTQEAQNVLPLGFVDIQGSTTGEEPNGPNDPGYCGNTGNTAIAIEEFPLE